MPGEEPASGRTDSVEAVAVTALVPVEVRAFIDRKAARAFKSRSRYVRDLLVGLYTKEERGGVQP